MHTVLNADSSSPPHNGGPPRPLGPDVCWADSPVALLPPRTQQPGTHQAAHHTSCPANNGPSAWSLLEIVTDEHPPKQRQQLNNLYKALNNGTSWRQKVHVAGMLPTYQTQTPTLLSSRPRPPCPACAQAHALVVQPRDVVWNATPFASQGAIHTRPCVCDDTKLKAQKLKAHSANERVHKQATNTAGGDVRRYCMAAARMYRAP